MFPTSIDPQRPVIFLGEIGHGGGREAEVPNSYQDKAVTDWPRKLAIIRIKSCRPIDLETLTILIYISSRDASLDGFKGGSNSRRTEWKVWIISEALAVPPIKGPRIPCHKKGRESRSFLHNSIIILDTVSHTS